MVDRAVARSVGRVGGRSVRSGGRVVDRSGGRSDGRGGGQAFSRAGGRDAESTKLKNIPDKNISGGGPPPFLTYFLSRGGRIQYFAK